MTAWKQKINNFLLIASLRSEPREDEICDEVASGHVMFILWRVWMTCVNRSFGDCSAISKKKSRHFVVDRLHSQIPAKTAVEV